MTFSPTELTQSLGRGLLSFPLTFFDEHGGFNEDGYRAHVASQGTAGASGLFAAGGTGEFFSLTLEEYKRVVRAASDEVPDTMPLLAGVGYGTHMAVEFAKAAEANGADGLLVLPPYLVKSEQDGLRRHLTAICRSVGIGVIAYNRDNAILTPETLERVAQDCPNLIGFKDGVGDVGTAQLIVRAVADEGRTDVAFFNGLLTAELTQAAYRGIGIPLYSSAAFAMAPEIANAYYRAYVDGDERRRLQLLDGFYAPLVRLRDETPGFGVSLIKAGLRLGGLPVGSVRPPLVDPTPAQEARLAQILEDGRALL